MTLRFLRYPLIAAVLASALVALPQHGNVAHADDQTYVSEASNVFAPNVITIAAGTTVVWTNNEDPSSSNNIHDVIEDNFTFTSEYYGPGDSYAFTFATPGTYHYYCDLHDNMDGYVVVQ